MTAAITLPPSSQTVTITLSPSISISTTTETTSTEEYCPISTNFFKDPGFESGDLTSSWDISWRNLPVFGVRCDGPGDWAYNSRCGSYALFGDNSESGTFFSGFQKFEQCYRGLYEMSFFYKITAGCVLDINYAENFVVTLNSTGSPSVWEQHRIGIPWPVDATSHGVQIWEFLARPLGAQSRLGLRAKPRKGGLGLSHNYII